MRRLILLGCVIGLLAGCATLPPETITAQEIVGTGIETARRNQLLLIDKFAEEARNAILLKFRLAIPSVLKKKHPENTSYGPGEVETLLVQYGNDIESELKKIDNKRVLLVRDTNEFFGDLQSINSLNLELLKSAVEINKVYKAAFDKIKDGVNSKIPEIISQ